VKPKKIKTATGIRFVDISLTFRIECSVILACLAYRASVFGKEELVGLTKQKVDEIVRDRISEAGSSAMYFEITDDDDQEDYDLAEKALKALMPEWFIRGKDQTDAKS